MPEAEVLELPIRHRADEVVGSLRDVVKAMDDLAAAWRRFETAYRGAPPEVQAAVARLLPKDRR